MNKAKLLLCITLAGILIFSQVPIAFAAAPLEETLPVSGRVAAVTMEVDIHTGSVTFLVTVEDELGGKQTVRVSEETAYSLSLIDYDDDGKPVIVDMLPESVDIEPTVIIPGEEIRRHPVANALSTFFTDKIEGLDYNIIMEAHTAGNGFGVIAQALWVIKKLGGSADDFVLLLEAKKSGDYSYFALEDGTIPTTWGQLRKAVSGNLGMIMSHHDKEMIDKDNKDNNGNPKPENSTPDKDKGKNNNGHANANGNGHGNKP